MAEQDVLEVQDVCACVNPPRCAIRPVKVGKTPLCGLGGWERDWPSSSSVARHEGS
jgi:hypothetical protein